MPSREQNRAHFNEEYDWSDGGEFWTPPDPAWREQILEHTMRRWFKSGARILEIGPGGGRWTAELLRYEPTRLVLVDIAPKCLELCRRRFAGRSEIEYHETDGRTLPALGPASLDFLWSFDVFVHIELEDTDAYLTQLSTLLAPGAIGIVHYASLDRAVGADPRAGWRADSTSSQMFELLARHGMTVLADHFHPQLAAGNSSVVVFRR